MGVATTRDGPSSKNVAIEAKRELAQRVVESSAFAKSERLSSFLICICDLSLSGRAGEINEQKIGTTVFGRPRDYDSTIDGIVRPQASRLRQRLDIYFNGEGSEEPIRITLPRGSYVPVFEPHAPPNPALHASNPPADSFPASVPGELASTPRKARSAPWAWMIVSALLVALLILGVKRPTPATTKAAASPTSHPLWGLLFRPDQQTMVVPSDT